MMLQGIQLSHCRDQIWILRFHLDLLLDLDLLLAVFENLLCFVVCRSVRDAEGTRKSFANPEVASVVTGPRL